MGLRVLGWAALGIVFGYLLANVRMERERAVLVARLEELERRLAHRPRSNVLNSFLPGLPLPGRPSAGRRHGPNPAPSETSDAVQPERGGDPQADPAGELPAAGNASQPSALASAQRRDARTNQDDPRLSPSLQDDTEDDAEAQGDDAEGGADTMVEQFEQLASTQRARAAASRAALIQQAGLSEAQVAQVDAMVKRMNDQLSGYAEEMLDQATREDATKPVEALGLGHDVSGILFEGQKELDSIVGDAADKVEPSALEAWNYIDVEQWRPFVQQRSTDKKVPAGGR